MKGYKKIIYVSLFLLLFIIGVSKSSYATEVTYKAEYKDATTYNVMITGIEKEDGYDYRAMICQEKDVKGSQFISPLGKSFSIQYNLNTYVWEGDTTQALDGVKSYGVFEKTGQYYVYIAKRANNSAGDYEILDGPTEIAMPQLPSLGNRIKIQSDASGRTKYSIKVNGCNTMMHNGVKRTMKFYIGEVTDKNLLEKLNTDGIEAYGELLQYAKEQEKNLKQDSFEDIMTRVLDYNIVQNYNIENGKYYFIHMILDNENGTYVDVEDIGIYNGEVTNTGKKGLKNFKYEVTTVDTAKNETKIEGIDTQKSDSTIATKNLPKAGVSLIGIGVLLVIGISIITLYVKNKQYKDI